MSDVKHSRPQWHAPGLGEVHNQDHNLSIYCEETSLEVSPNDPDMIVSDALATRVCATLNQHEALLRDAARLDWMEKTRYVVVELCRLGTPDGEKLWDMEFGDECYFRFSGTLRGAIDKAMKVDQKRGGEDVS